MSSLPQISSPLVEFIAVQGEHTQKVWDSYASSFTINAVASIYLLHFITG